MVDPVLCDDGRVHDRLVTHALPYLDPEVSLPRPVRIIGEDISLRSQIHEAHPQVAAQFTARLQMMPRPTAPLASSLKENIPLAAHAQEFRVYQFRRRDLRSRWERLTRYPKVTGVLPLQLSYHVFSHFGLVQPHVSYALVQHLRKHNVLLSGQVDRHLGNLEVLQSALNAFCHGGRVLGAEQRARITQIMEAQADLQAVAWQVQAEVTQINIELAAIARYLSINPAMILRSGLLTCRQRALVARRSQLQREAFAMRGRDPAAEPLITRRPALQGIRDVVRSASFTAPKPVPQATDADATHLTCPISLDTMTAPVLCNDGYTYDLFMLLNPDLCVSPMTRQPLRMLARHPAKAAYAQAIHDGIDTATLQSTHDTLTGAFAAAAPKGGLADRVLTYQRRARHGTGKAAPDKVSWHIFSHFGVVKTRDQSMQLMLHLTNWGVLGDTPGYERHVQSMAYLSHALDAWSRTAALTEQTRSRWPQALSQTQSTMVARILAILETETQRRAPLLARTRYLGLVLDGLRDKTCQRYRDTQLALQALQTKLDALPSDENY